MHTQTGDLTEVWREIRMIWRIIGRLEATGGALRRENDQMRRDMRESKAKAGWPLWVHLTAMAAISVLSILGIIKPEMAKAFAIKLLFKLAAG